MGALTMVARAARRRRIAGLVLLAVVMGAAGGAVLASAAGARRTASSLDRFRAESRAADVELDVQTATPQQIAELRRHPSVERLGWMRQVMLAPQGTGPEGGFLPAAAAVDTHVGRDIDRARVLEGRRADPGAAHEIELGEAAAEQTGLGVGDRFTVASYTPEQTAAGGRGEAPGAPAGPPVTFRVVGIVRRPLDLGVAGGSGGVLLLTPAFHERYRERIGGYVDGLLRVRARDGTEGAADVVRAARGMFGDDLFQVIGVAEESAGVSDAIDVVATALWVFVAVAGIATATAVSIIVVRQLGAQESEQASLAALGLTRRQRALANVGVVAPSALVGGALAAVVAVALSPLLPFGVARQAEPDPGLALDGRAVGIGTLAIVVGVLLVAALAGWRVAGTPERRRNAGDVTRPTFAARVASSAGASPTLGTGVRLAFEPGRGTRAVPVRTALIGTTLGVLGVTAALVFAASVGHLTDTPRLFGWSWDAVLELRAPVESGPSGRCSDVRTPFASDPAVVAVGAACLEAVEVDRRPVTGWFLESERGRLTPAVVAGRAPQVDDEVALGSGTLDAIGKEIGDTVHIRGERAHRFRIVGRVVLPHLDREATDPIAEGALFTGPAMTALFEPTTAPNRYLVGSLAPAEDAIAATGGSVRLRSGRATRPGPPAEVTRLTQVDELPAALAALLAVLAVVSVAHVVLMGIRRRRHDLGILRAIGFTRRDVRATIGYQATLVGVVGLVVGIPAGIVVGRAAWTAVADGIGAVPVVVVPWPALVVTVLATLAAVNVIGAVGARAALRDEPAVVLAAE